MNNIIMEKSLQVLYEQVEIEIKDGDYQQALFALDNAMEFLGNRPDEHQIYGKIKILYAEVNRCLGKFYSAIKCVNEALDFYRLRQEYKEVFRTREIMGDIFFQYGKYVEAVEEWETALQLLSLFNDDSEIIRAKAHICIKLGEVLNFLSDYKRARSNYFRGLNFSRSVNDQILIGRFQLGIGSTYHLENRFQIALKVYYQALKLAKQNNDKFLIGRLLHSFGDIFTKTGQVKKAKKNYEKSLEITEKVRDFATSASNLRELGRLNMKTDSDKTLYYYERSFDKLIENISTDTRGECERLMGKNFYLMALYYFKLKEYKLGMKSLVEAGEIFHKYSMEKEKKRAHILHNQITHRRTNSQSSNQSPFPQAEVLSVKLGIG